MDIPSMIISFANQNPNIASLLIAMGVARAIFKPVFSLAHAYVEATASPEDDAKLAEIESSKFITTLSFILERI